MECKQRNINTPEIRDALDLLEPRIQPDWLKDCGESYVEREGQLQMLRAPSPVSGKPAAELVRNPMDALAVNSMKLNDMAVKEELERLPKKYRKLKPPWKFVSR